MGVQPTTDSSLSKQLQQYERFLSELNLSRAHLDTQDLDQLYRSLDRVNTLIASPGSMPKIRISILLVDMEMGSLPVLLNTKDYILQRIATLGGNEASASLRAQVASLSDPAVRKELDGEIDRLEERARQLEWERQRLSQERDIQFQKLQRDFEEAVEQRKFEQDQKAREARAKTWQRFFARESVATIVGAVILVTLTICLIVAMFTTTEASSVLSNSFLIILGYFFGQTTGQAVARIGAERDQAG